MRPAKGEAVSEAVDPLRKFFDDLGHRIDQYPVLTPAGQAWPTLETFDLYNAWLRFNQQRRELRIREGQVKALRAELKRRDRAVVERDCGQGWDVSDHRANGRIVAQVRRWLEILDNAAEDYGDVETLSRLISYSGYECELTVDHVRTLLAEHDAYRTEARRCHGMSQTGFTYRCGFQIEHSLNLLPDRPGAYRVSRGGQSNIIGAKFFDEINGDSDHAFVEFMTAALRPDFPHPFAMEE